MKNYFVNEQIRSNLVILIDAEGVNKGQFLRAAALTQARTAGLDLVQVSDGRPPVCKVADFGKMQYDRSKSEKGHSKQPEQKEMWFTPNTAKADIERKMKQVGEWVAKNHKVLLAVELKGRERFDQNQRAITRDLLKSLAVSLGERVSADRVSEGGKATSMMLHPKSS